MILAAILAALQPRFRHKNHAKLDKTPDICKKTAYIINFNTTQTVYTRNDPLLLSSRIIVVI